MIIKRKSYAPIRPLRFDGSIAFIALTQGMEAIIDADDASLVLGVNWYAVCDQRKYYAQRKIWAGDIRKTLKLHRLILAVDASLVVDHVNGNGLDCRRANLRAATCAQNLWNAGPSANNKSGFKGVHWSSSAGKWQAQIMFNMKKKSLGYFEDKNDAHKAYQAAAAKYHGEFARS